MTPTKAIQVTIVALALIALAIVLMFLIAYNSVDQEITTDEAETSENFLDDLTSASYVYSTDPDCPYDYGPDMDEDNIIDFCDNCPEHYNPEQDDSDHDDLGDTCDYSSQNDEADEDNDDDEEVECESDSDCGTDGYIGDLFCTDDDVTQEYISYTCTNPGDEDSDCTDETTTEIVETCDDICDDGECVTNLADLALVDLLGTDDRILIKDTSEEIIGSELMCNTDYTVTVKVENLGQAAGNSQVRGTLVGDQGQGHSFGDDNPAEVMPGDSLIRSFNISLNLSEGDYILNMATLPISDADYMNNVALRNISIICQQEIACHIDLDCGTDNFVGGPFCSALDVLQVFESYTCHEPGTDESYCSSQEEDQLMQECPDACVDGQCVGITCYSDSDCDDQNPDTQDTCYNLGTIDAFCAHDPIACFFDSDCGIDGFLGDPFCVLDTIYQYFEEFMCINPGFADSMCDSSPEQQEILDCDYACSDGSCVRCDENSDCNDQNPNTEDICMFQDTAMSYCENNPVCTSECSQGEQQCSGNGYQVCDDFNGDGCYEWSSTTPCSFGEVCISGVCETSCSDQCIDGERRCSGNGYQVCDDFSGDGCYEWSFTTPCSFGEVCIFGECI